MDIVLQIKEHQDLMQLAISRNVNTFVLSTMCSIDIFNDFVALWSMNV